jgi:hypothetical protein
VYYVSSYNLKEKKALEYQKWLMSDDAKKLFADVEKGSGWRYMGTFWAIMGFGDFDCEDWWEVPDWSAFDTLRVSEAGDRLAERFSELDFGDSSRPSSTRMLRTTSDVRIFE